MTVEIEQGKCTVVKSELSPDPVDAWGMTFPIFHNPLLHSDTWSIVGEESYVATSTVKGWPRGASTESTTMVLTVKQMGN